MCADADALRIDGLATTLAALRASVRADPRGHGGRVGLGLVGNDEALR